MVSFTLGSNTTPHQGRALSTSRCSAAGIHLAISAAIACGVLLGMLFFFYPSPYFVAVGGKDLLMILICVDVVLGPLITLIIFNPKKKSLKWDLTAIGVMQVAALIYGAYTMFEARPVYTVFAKDKFVVLTANNIDPKLLAKVTRPEFKNVPVMGPAMVIAKQPDNEKEQQDLVFIQAMGVGIQYMPQYYVPYKEAVSLVLEQAKPLSQLKKQNPKSYEAVAQIGRSLGKQESEVVFLPVNARKQVMTALLDSKTGELLKIEAVSPWR
jgi:hypothetical protein